MGSESLPTEKPFLTEDQEKVNDCARCLGARWLSVGKMSDPPGSVNVIPCDRCNPDGSRKLLDPGIGG